MKGFEDMVSPASWGFFPAQAPYVIAGPCSAETEKQVMDTAAALREQGVTVFRAGLWKPRTRPGCFEGAGEKGLPWLLRVKEKLGMAVCTEVAGAQHARACLDAGIDMLWIGARTTVNPFLVQEIAETLGDADVPVLVKNPVNPDMGLWKGAMERLYECGVRKIGAVHRGFSASGRTEYRNHPFWNLAISFRSEFPGIPLFCDPSHLGGDRRFVQELSQKAMDIGFDGLMIESHINPSCALSDPSQQLTPGELASLMSSLVVRSADSLDSAYRRTLELLRLNIDELDRRLIDALAERREISRQIGGIKRDHNVSIVQAMRWEDVMDRALAEGKSKGLDEDFIRRIFDIIHENSVSEQNKILEQ